MVARVFDLQPTEASDASSSNESTSELQRLIQARAQPEPPRQDALDFMAPRVGRIVSVDAHEICVLFEGATRPTPARLALAASLEELERACSEQQEVLLVFERADRERPIVTGLISAPTRAPAPREPLPESMMIEADADGQRLRLSAQEEIVFQCGRASVTLTKSGRVILRGTYVETHASGTNRIKGGQVRIN